MVQLRSELDHFNNFKLEIRSQTDCIGDSKYFLSYETLKISVEYFEKGILNLERITSRGFEKLKKVVNWKRIYLIAINKKQTNRICYFKMIKFVMC